MTDGNERSCPEEECDNISMVIFIHLESYRMITYKIAKDALAQELYTDVDIHLMN